jgi:hypothetical protein
MFYYFAQEIGEPSLCDRISWEAHRRYSIMFAGGGASYFRADCYEQVAKARHDASACWRVRPLIDWDPFSPGYSALACRRRTRAGELGGIGLGDTVLVHTFQRLGYDIDQLHLDGVIEPAIRIEDVYRGIPQDSAAMGRAARQLRHTPTAGLTGNDPSYLADLLAIGTADPKWCRSIPMDQVLSQEQAVFRDWCYFTVAVNTRDARICEAMTPASAEPKVRDAIMRGVRPEIAEQLSLRNQCSAIEHPVGDGTALRYGPELPQDSRQMLRLITTLGVAIPRARDWPAPQMAAYFQRFLFSLAPSHTDAMHDSARARLLRRLLTLPDSVP